MFSRLKMYIFVIVIAFCMSACSSSIDNLTINTLLELRTKNDVVECFGKPASTESYDHYDVIFMDNKFSMLVNYNEEALEHILLTYYFIGMQDIELAMDMLSYSPSLDDINKAELFVKELVSSFEEKFGEPEIFNSPVETKTYIWTVEGCEIQVQDNIDNEQLSLIGAIEVKVKY